MEISKLEKAADMSVEGISNVLDFVTKPATIAVLGMFIIGYIAKDSNDALMQRIDYLNQELAKYETSCYVGEK